MQHASYFSSLDQSKLYFAILSLRKTSQGESSFNVTCTAFFRVLILPPHPYSTYVQKYAHATPELAKWSKSPTRLCIVLLAILTTSLATNDSMQITRPEANLTKMINLANNVMVNVANVATSSAMSRSMQMTRQMRKHSNCEFVNFSNRNYFVCFTYTYFTEKFLSVPFRDETVERHG